MLSGSMHLHAMVSPCKTPPCCTLLLPLSFPASPHISCLRCVPAQLVDELLAFWTLEDYETTLEELEEALIVSTGRREP